MHTEEAMQRRDSLKPHYPSSSNLNEFRTHPLEGEEEEMAVFLSTLQTDPAEGAPYLTWLIGKTIPRKINAVIQASRTHYFTSNHYFFACVQKYTNIVTDHITIKSDFAHGCIKEAIGALNPTKAKTSSNIFQGNSFHFVLFGGMYTASPRPQLYNLGFPHCF